MAAVETGVLAAVPTAAVGTAPTVEVAAADSGVVAAAPTTAVPIAAVAAAEPGIEQATLDRAQSDNQTNWMVDQMQAAQIVDWFRGQPASSAADAEIAEWFRGHPEGITGDAENVDWFRGQPTSSAADAEIAEWFKGQQGDSAADTEERAYKMIKKNVQPWLLRIRVDKVMRAGEAESFKLHLKQRDAKVIDMVYLLARCGRQMQALFEKYCVPMEGFFEAKAFSPLDPSGFNLVRFQQYRYAAKQMALLYKQVENEVS